MTPGLYYESRFYYDLFYVSRAYLSWFLYHTSFYQYGMIVGLGFVLFLLTVVDTESQYLMSSCWVIETLNEFATQ